MAEKGTLLVDRLAADRGRSRGVCSVGLSCKAPTLSPTLGLCETHEASRHMGFTPAVSQGAACAVG